MMRKKSIRWACLAALDIIAPLFPIPDKLYLKTKYYLRMGKKLNLSNPSTFTEKLQWLKLYGRRPIDTLLSDKYEVKKYVSNLIGDKYVIPLLGIWDHFDEIDFSSLPNAFVLKCTHDSGGVVVCQDKSRFDVSKAKRIIERGLKHNFYVYSREKAYKDIPRRIIAEQYKVDSRTQELRDYKFFCFNGIPKVLFIASDRQSVDQETKFDFFDMDFNHLPITNGHPNATTPPEKPLCFEEMKAIAAKLSSGIPHVRIDLYEADGRIFFGEYTFSHWGGMMPFNPESWDKIMGDWIDLKSEA